MTQYDINITSDIVCPWCYIGHSRLSRAIATHKKQYPDDKFNLTYAPFYLNPPAHLTTGGPISPSFPVQSRDKKGYYAEKFGAGRTAQIETTMKQTFAGEGLTFKFGGKTGPSRNGHRLVRWAQDKGGEDAQNRTMLGLWRRYFEQEVDITELDVLVEVGVEAKLGSAEEVKEFLESGRDGEIVDKLAEEGRRNGVTGVPNYVIQGLWEVGGAQEPAAFEHLFKRYKQMEQKGQVDGSENKSANGTSCL